MISTVNSRSERIVIRGVKLGKVISSTCPIVSGAASCEATNNYFASDELLAP
jgi:hypothetical protein